MNNIDYLIKHLKAALFWCCFFMFVLFWLSMDNGKSEYTHSLEKVVAKCLDGGAVTIGDKVYLCATYDTGTKL